MNILIFATAPSLENPKIASFVLARISELKKNGHNVVVLQRGNLIIGIPNLKTLFSEGPYIYLQKFYHFIKAGKNKKKIFKNNICEYEYYDSLFFSTYEKFSKWYKDNKFDLIHSHFVWTSYSLPMLKEYCNIKYIVTTHGSDIHTNPFKSEKCKNDTLEILNQADGVFYVSNFLYKKALELGVENQNILITGNGYYPEMFYPKKHRKLDTNNVLLGFVGNPIKIKRFDILPEVLNNVKQKYPGTKLICIGSTGKKQDLRESVKKKLLELGILDSVTFIDKVPYSEVSNYMRKIDILLMPSINEGYSCAPLEAQACGTPVISSANGGLPESTGNIGLCVSDSPYFIKDFSNRIIEYIKNPYEQEYIVKQSLNKDWNSVVSKEIEAYKKYIFCGENVVLSISQ